MKLTVLGSGSAISGANRATSGFVLDLPNEKIIIDFGFGCFKNLQKAGFDFTKVNTLLFTHFEHPDHINDLSAFLFARKGSVFLGKSKPTQVNILGGPGFEKFFKKLLEAYPLLQDPRFNLKVSELELFSTKKFAGFSLTTKQMKHVPSSLGFRFEVRNKIIAFTGDTEMNENIVDLAKDADLLVIECSYATKDTTHLNALQVAEIAFKANAKAVLLVHFYPEAEKADLKTLVAKKFKGRIHIAEDLMQVSI